MKTIVFASFLGLLVGAAVAWWLPFGMGAARSTSTPATPTVAAAPRPAKLSGTASPSLLSAWTEATTGAQGFSQRMALLALVMRAQSADMPRLLALTKNQAFARELLLRRWVELDPEAAVAFVTPALRGGVTGVFGGGGTEAGEAMLVMQAWAKTNPEAALAHVKAEAGPFSVRFIRNSILETVLTDDMERGLKLVSATEGESALSFGISIDMAWVAKDPARAAQLLATVPDSDFRNQALMRAMTELGQKDLPAVIALMEKFPGLGSAGGNPRFVNGRMESVESGDPRQEMFEKWAKSDLTAMTSFLNDKAEGPTRAAMKEAMAKVIGEGEPRTALEWAADNLSGDRRRSVMEKVLGKLSKENPAEALDYLATLPKGSALDGAVDFFNNSLGKADTASRLAQARALPDSPARSKLLGSAYQWWYVEAPAEAIRDLAKQSTDQLPTGVWRDLGQSTSDLASGLKQLSDVPAEQGADFVGGLFSRHAQWNSDLAKTAESLAEVKDAAQRTAAISALTNNWAWRDPAGLVEWAAKLPRTEERHQVRDQLTSTLQRLPEGERTKLLSKIKE